MNERERESERKRVGGRGRSERERERGRNECANVTERASESERSRRERETEGGSAKEARRHTGSPQFHDTHARTPAGRTDRRPVMSFAIRSLVRQKKKKNPTPLLDRSRMPNISSDVKAPSPVPAPEYFARHLRHPPLAAAHVRDERFAAEKNRAMILRD